MIFPAGFFALKNIKYPQWISTMLLEHCNACNKDMDDVERHIAEPEHLANVEKIKQMFRSKTYEGKRRGIDV